MALELSETTQAKLAKIPERLEQEFPDIAPERIRCEIAAVAGGLAQEATIQDFLPVLVDRYTREHLGDLRRTERLAA